MSKKKLLMAALKDMKKNLFGIKGECMPDFCGWALIVILVLETIMNGLLIWKGKMTTDRWHEYFATLAALAFTFLVTWYVYYVIEKKNSQKSKS